ncbi:MAG: hypothetical protein J7527_19865 [Chitinophagaceae bacterium]|nr:hypothetical protein [Chitinophagaceae bacterium]
MLYTISPRTLVDFGEGVAPAADVTTVANGEAYFERMENRELIDNAPIFDYFSMETTDRTKPETWEWLLQDVLTFTRGEIPIKGWLVSDYFKQVLEQFIIAPPYRFYRSKLKYRNTKLDYFLFNILGPDLEKLVVFEKLRFGLAMGRDELPVTPYDATVHNKKDVSNLKFQLLKNERKYLTVTSVQVTQYFDFLPLWGLNYCIIISERLKTAIEQARIEGVVIEPVTFEVIMPGLE